MAAAPPPPPADPVSSTRLYLGNLPSHATKADVENHFKTHGTGQITEVKLMNGFGFIEYEDSMDARDVVPAFHGSDFMGNRLVVQFARGNRPRSELPPFHERLPPRTRRTQFRMSITNLPVETSWQDLKDFARSDGLDVVYSEVSRERDGRGFVEYETQKDLATAVEKLDNFEFKGTVVHCFEDVKFPNSRPPPNFDIDFRGVEPLSEHSSYPQSPRSPHLITLDIQIQPERPRDRFRSRSPPRRGGYGAPGGGAGGGFYDEYYDRRGPPARGYTPREYRERSPPRREYYEDRRYGRSPPPMRRGPPGPVDEYAAPRRGGGGGGGGGGYPAEDYPPPSRGYGRGPQAPYPEDPYMNGRSGGYERPPLSPRRRSPGPPPARGGYEGGGYDRRSGGGY